MTEDLKSLQCFHCGRTYQPHASGRENGMVCSGCGMEAVPLVDKEIKTEGKEGFLIVLGFFAVVALLGAVGGIMLIHGWNFWVTFGMIGGIIYLVGRIFIGTYTVRENNTYPPDELVQEDCRPGNTPDFDKLVVEAIHELPQGIRDRLSNVAVIVEDKPNKGVLDELKLMSNKTLLGVFQGVPLNKKSVWQYAAMPERITIFQNNIEALCRSDEEIKRRIKKVVRHEVAHFVGFSEDEVRKMGY